jgi:integrase
MARRAVPEGKQRIRASEGIYLKANGKYLATYRDPGRKQRWAEFRTLGEAKAWRARARLDPSSLAVGKRTLQEVWEGFLKHHGPNLRPTTRANWQQEWRRHIAPFFASWPIGKITVLAVKDFLADLERTGVGAATRHKCRAILYRLLEEAVENAEIPSNPVAARGTRVKLPQRRRARVLSAVEVEQVLRVAREMLRESDALAIEALFVLGLRIGELAGLQAADIDISRREIVIRRTVTDVGGVLQVQNATKTNTFRVLPVPEDLPFWSRLVLHVKSHGLIGQAPLFPAPEGGHLRPNNWRRRVWAPVMRAAGVLDPPSPHSGRRTTASLLSAAGVPPATIQAVLGHSTLQQTGEYVDVAREALVDGLSRLSSL